MSIKDKIKSFFGSGKKNENDSKSKIFPVIKVVENNTDNDANVAINLPSSQKPIKKELLGQLIIMYAIDNGEYLSFLSENMIQQFGLTKETLHDKAIENLKRISKNTTIQGDGNSFQIKLDGDLDSSLILLPDIWNEIKAKIQSDPVIFMPGRELVYFFRYDYENLESTLAQLQEINFDSNKLHLLNNDVYIWKDNKLQMYSKQISKESIEKDQSIDELTQKIEQNAAVCVDHFKDRFTLDFSEDSLNNIEEVLAEASEFKNDIPDQKKSWIVNIIGSYVFEVARQTYGGKYYFYEQGSQPILVTGEPDFAISILVFDKIKGRIENGKEDNIPFFFQGYSERVKNAKVGDKALIV